MAERGAIAPECVVGATRLEINNYKAGSGKLCSEILGVHRYSKDKQPANQTIPFASICTLVGEVF